MKKYMLAGLLFNLSLSAWASHWVALPLAAADAYYADTSSISKDASGYVRVWVKTDYMKPFRTADGIPSSYAVVRYSIDCRGNRMDMPAGRYYSVEGKVVGQWDQVGAYQEITPDTVADGLVRSVCRLAGSS